MRSSHSSPMPAECPPGRYGKRCALSCSCANGSSCHHATGACLCAAGWSGPHCSQRGYGDTGTRMRAGARGLIISSPHHQPAHPAPGGMPAPSVASATTGGRVTRLRGRATAPRDGQEPAVKKVEDPHPQLRLCAPPGCSPGGVIWGCCLSSMELHGATHPLYPCRVPPWDLRIAV